MQNSFHNNILRLKISNAKVFRRTIIFGHFDNIARSRVYCQILLILFFAHLKEISLILVKTLYLIKIWRITYSRMCENALTSA